jgi:hypothetical protein
MRADNNFRLFISFVLSFFLFLVVLESTDGTEVCSSFKSTILMRVTGVGGGGGGGGGGCGILYYCPSMHFLLFFFLCSRSREKKQQQKWHS